MVRDYAHTNIEFDYTNKHRDLFVGVDPISLTEAITNLIDNAIKYGPPSNHITLSIEKTDSTASVSVTDEGPGIPIEEMERVTQRFERHESTQDPHGSGLGLAIARTVAESQGGELKLLNLAPIGLKVSMILPLSK
jgi:two-component system sensor histidine kinase TctE